VVPRDVQRDVALEKFGWMGREDLGMIAYGRRASDHDRCCIDRPRKHCTDTAERTMGEVAIENISALWRLIHLYTGSQQSPELSCQPPLSVMSANGDWDFGRTAANIPHVAWYQISG